MSEGFGTPKFGRTNNNSYVKAAYMKDGAPVTGRLIPPVGDNAASGTWQVYYGTHFGFYGVGKEGKRALRLFKCIEKIDFKTKMKIVSCPVCDKYEDLKALVTAQEKPFIDAADADFARNHDQAKRDAAYEAVKNDKDLLPYRTWLKEHNVSRNWHTYIMTPEGEFQELQTSHKTNKLLIGDGKGGDVGGVVAKARNDGVDPFDVNGGCYFTWTRTGRWTQAQDTVEIVTETVTLNGVRAKVTKSAPLTLEQQQAALKLPNLHHNTKTLTVEQIQALADLSLSPDPEEVDAILGYSQRADEPESETSVSVPGFTAPTTPAAPAAPTTKSQAEILAAVAELRSQATSAPSTPPASTTAPAPVSVQVTTATPATAHASADVGAMNRAKLEAMFGKKKS